MNRGELWTVSGGVYAAKPRPALIIQDDLFGATDSIVVIPLTTTVTQAPIARIEVPVSAGIRQASYAMIDKITTVRRSNLGERLGRLPASALVEVERSLMVYLGLAS